MPMPADWQRYLAKAGPLMRWTSVCYRVEPGSDNEGTTQRPRRTQGRVGCPNGGEFSKEGRSTGWGDEGLMPSVSLDLYPSVEGTHPFSVIGQQFLQLKPKSVASYILFLNRGR